MNCISWIRQNHHISWLHAWWNHSWLWQRQVINNHGEWFHFCFFETCKIFIKTTAEHFTIVSHWIFVNVMYGKNRTELMSQFFFDKEHSRNALSSTTQYTVLSALSQWSNCWNTFWEQDPICLPILILITSPPLKVIEAIPRSTYMIVLVNMGCTCGQS